MATVVMATVPLVTLLLAAAQGLERLRLRSAVGGLLALAGIAWMTLGPQHVVVPLGALAAMLAAASCVGQSVILGKRLSANHPAMTNAVGMTLGAVLLLSFSAAAGEPWAGSVRYGAEPHTPSSRRRRPPTSRHAPSMPPSTRRWPAMRRGSEAS